MNIHIDDIPLSIEDIPDLAVIQYHVVRNSYENGVYGDCSQECEDSVAFQIYLYPDVILRHPVVYISVKGSKNKDKEIYLGDLYLSFRVFEQQFGGKSRMPEFEVIYPDQFRQELTWLLLRHKEVIQKMDNWLIT